MNLYLSKKIKTISFILIVLIVFLHSYNLIINYKTGSVVLNPNFSNFLVQKFISDGLCRIAVPIFFIISGLLFFINGESFNFYIYKIKLKRRIRTILLPFLLWSFLVAIIIYLAQLTPIFEHYFYKFTLHEFSFYQWLKILFVHPINYQLWFLQVLFCLVVASPIIYVLVKYLKFFSVIIALFVWYASTFSFLGIPIIEGITFFTIGSYIGLNKDALHSRMKKLPLSFLLVLWILFNIIKLYYEVNQEVAALEFWEKTSILIGLVFFWFFIDHIIHPLNMIDKRYNIYGYSFFIFLFHEPTLVALKKVLLQTMGTGVTTNFATYLLAPIITIFLALILGKFLKRKCFGFYNLLTGFR